MTAICTFSPARCNTSTNNGYPPRRAGRARFCVGGSRGPTWARRAAAIRLQDVGECRAIGSPQLLLEHAEALDYQVILNTR